MPYQQLEHFTDRKQEAQGQFLGFTFTLSSLYGAGGGVILGQVLLTVLGVSGVWMALCIIVGALLMSHYHHMLITTRIKLVVHHQLRVATRQHIVRQDASTQRVVERPAHFRKVGRL